MTRYGGTEQDTGTQQVQRKPGAPCPECGSYDLGTEHVGGGQSVAACNDCPWVDER